MNRREVLMGMGSLGALLGTMGAPNAVAAAGKKGASGTYGSAVDTALDCVKRGKACISHCQMLLSKGDTSMGNCLKKVLEMTAMCEAFATLASYESPHIKKIAVICAEMCRDCEKVCREHEKHPVCKDCAESCAACAKECDKIAA